MTLNESMKQSAEHFEWRKKIQKELPSLASRVFALREKSYYGCGFHYGLEQKLGAVIKMANSIDALQAYEMIADELLYKELVDGTKRAEWSAEHNSADPAAPGSPWFEAKEQKTETKGGEHDEKL